MQLLHTEPGAGTKVSQCGQFLALAGTECWPMALDGTYESLAPLALQISSEQFDNG
jgi:hypothetical protein